MLCDTDVSKLSHRQIKVAVKKAKRDGKKVKYSATGKIEKTKVITKKVMCDTDVCNLSSVRYHDQTNMDEVKTVIQSNISNLTKAISFQKRYVTSWNINSMKASEVMYLELSKFDEISNDGCIQMLVELLYDYGLINKHDTKKGHYQPAVDLDHKRF